ncbi:YihY/virulence factor BrkB family protein [Acetobacteroides hydrogenigenes]|uniref:Membrane protein n=1 Tax=Acetobacteroides hydrogenigenes TaxID=979970 RepID=A0A4R2F1Q5_9BACT|nr:YihY/virulence factor BrkB family protein [Acetobacteroides hydrogenigenes]TCN73285.1 membrane protein [Acetobacteroides hydrogenigenes]
MKIKWVKKNKKVKFGERIRAVNQFLFSDIWKISLAQNPKQRGGLWIRSLRIAMLAVRGFKEDNVAIRASALSFFTTIAIVPIFAMFFGIAKGFNLDKNLEAFLKSKFEGQQEVLSWIMNFSNSLLEKTMGGLLAGIGFVVLLWSVLRVFNNIELSFNAIWHLEKGRNLTRKFSDYFSLILVAPILLIASSSANVYLATTLHSISEQYVILDFVAPIFLFLLKLIPYLLVGILFTIIYVVMPNTKVNFKAALIAGIIAGTAFELVQWGYIYFQVGMSRNNAIYGSFAALPLFMVWQQTSWIIMLVGAEISFAIQNAHLYEYEYEIENVSNNDRRTLSVLLMSRIVKCHIKGDKPFTSEELSEELQMPVRMVRLLLGNLVKGNLLVETYTDDPKSRGYVPAISDESITICKIYDILDHLGVDDVILPSAEAYARICSITDEMDQKIRNSDLNVRVAEL